MNDPNVLETNPTRPGYVNPMTHIVNPGFTAGSPATTPPTHAPAPLPATLPDVTTRVGHLETLARSFFERLVAVEAKHKAIHDGTK